jgi:hypothetical protein
MQHIQTNRIKEIIFILPILINENLQAEYRKYGHGALQIRISNKDDNEGPYPKRISILSKAHSELASK